MVTNQTVEDSHGLKLMAVLHESVRTRGERATADWLGIDRRTLVTCLESGELSLKVRVALDNEIRAEISSEQAEFRDLVRKQGERIGDLEGRAAGFAGDFERLETALKAVREELNKELRELTRRMERLNTRGVQETSSGAVRRPAGSGAGKSGTKTGRTGNPLVAGSTAPRIEAPVTPTKPWFPPRDYKDVVTVEPAPDDSYVYEKAWPLVEEWRRLRRDHPREGKTLSWMERQERTLVVEMELLDDHKLTLPPEKMPIDDLWRLHILNWRRNDLHVIRMRIRRRKLLRCLRRLATFGFWWR